jgi:hypothetical protein
MARTKKIIALLLLTLTATVASAQILGNQFTVSGTPAQLTTTSTLVESVRLQVIPGYCGKIYVGLQGMNISTYANVLSVLYPNCTGGHSESFQLQDTSGQNTIDISTIYLAGQNAGDQISWAAFKTTATPVASLLPVPEAEVPAGTINGTNATFTLSMTPMVNTQVVFRNGVAYFPGSGDYLISGNTLTFEGTAIPQPGDHLVAVYWVTP